MQLQPRMQLPSATQHAVHVTVLLNGLAAGVQACWAQHQITLSNNGSDHATQADASLHPCSASFTPLWPAYCYTQVTKAFKRNKGGNRPGFAADLPPQQYNLPPLDGQQYAPTPQQQQTPPPQQQQQVQRPQTGGAPQPPRQQQQQQQSMPLSPQQPGWRPAPAQPAVQSPPAQPGFNQQPGFNNQPAVQSPPAQPGDKNNQPGLDQQQQGFVNNPPAQPGFNGNQQPGFSNQPGFKNNNQQSGFVSSSPAQQGFNNNQQPGFVNGASAPAAPQQTQGQNPPMYQNPAQGFQQQGGFVQPVQARPQQYIQQGQPQQGGYNAGGGWQQQPQQQQQPGFQQQGWSELGGYLDDMGGYIDSNGRVNPSK